MKYNKFLYPFLSIICIFTASTSCSDEGELSAITETGMVVTVVDGKRWKSESVWCVVDRGRLSLSGYTTNSSINLALENTAIGAYTVSGGAGNANQVHFSPESNDPLSNSSFSSGNLNESVVGEIVITAIDEVNQTISGSFYSKVGRHLPEEKTISIKVGTFTEIPYTEVTEVSVTSFSAKIDGEIFNIDRAESSITPTGPISLRFFGNDNMISIMMPKGIEAGLFEIGNGQVGNVPPYVGFCNFINDLFISESGNLVIASHDKESHHIAGTFSYDALGVIPSGSSISVTEGTFDVVYKEN